MKEINGIEVKDRVIRNDAVWRIVFVSSHIEMMRMAFGLKTLGFIYKPVIRRDICKWLDVVYMELMENIFIAVDDDSINVTYVSLEDIEFFKAEGNYNGQPNSYEITRIEEILPSPSDMLLAEQIIMAN